MNKFPLLSKSVIIGMLMIMLWIPLLMVQATIQERSRYRDQATREVANSHARQQVVSGPVLWVPFTERYPVTVRYGKEGEKIRTETRERASWQVVFPSRLETQAQIDTETRMRGIFPVTVYNSQQRSAGRFVWTPEKPVHNQGVIEWGTPRVLMNVSDVRGLLGKPELNFSGRTFEIDQITQNPHPLMPLGVDLKGMSLRAGEPLDFVLDLDLAGTDRLGWVPLADDNSVTVTSPWPHPNFNGSFLPRQRDVSGSGFSATWRVPSLSSSAQTTALDALKQTGANDGHRQHLENFAVNLQDPVDVYRLTDRAAKYGMLFVVLTFVGFFISEAVRRWRVHPMQYLMVGAALVVFFLLLLSLSEHVSFAMAYFSASAACIALLGYYLRHVLGGWRQSFGMSSMLVAVYGVLYGILMSEDNALMMGSFLLFAVLALVMIATRKIDWYNVMKLPSVGGKPQPPQPGRSGGLPPSPPTPPAGNSGGTGLKPA
ncbi:cell envelope integrity protein CreD [Hydrogenophaga sp. 5NK40-0174]|uniref:cell envelope integrity protein CreD n=1 Tax=Hydrogenophaga sp. 5NK40-0174 TaxID=3127649 RepID=UPI003107D0CC